MSVIKKSQLALYSLLSWPLAFVSLPLYIYAPDVYTSSGFLSLGLMGTILLFIRLFDAVQDPFIGRIIDKYPDKTIYILLLGLLCMLVGFAMVFHPNAPYLWWFTAAMILCTLGLSIVSILFHSVGALWKTNNTHDRTLITSAREGVGLLAVLSVVTMPLYLSFQTMSVMLFIITIIAFWGFRKWLHHAELMHKKVREHPFKFITLLSDKWIVHFYSVFLISHLASSIPAILVIFFIRDYLQAEEMTGLFLCLYFISGAVAMLLWQKIAQIYGKFQCWLGAMMIACVSFMWVMTLSPHDVIAYAIICVLSGSAVGANLTLPPSILADYTEDKTHNVSSYFAIIAFIPKISLALGSVVAFSLLEWGGYKAGIVSDKNTVLLWVYGLIPSVIQCLAIAALLLGIKFTFSKEVL